MVSLGGKNQNTSDHWIHILQGNNLLEPNSCSFQLQHGHSNLPRCLSFPIVLHQASFTHLLCFSGPCRHLSLQTLVSRPFRSPIKAYFVLSQVPHQFDKATSS